LPKRQTKLETENSDGNGRQRWFSTLDRSLSFCLTFSNECSLISSTPSSLVGIIFPWLESKHAKEKGYRDYEKEGGKKKRWVPLPQIVIMLSVRLTELRALKTLSLSLELIMMATINF